MPVPDLGRRAQEPGSWMNNGSSLRTLGVPESMIAGSRNQECSIESSTTWPVSLRWALIWAHASRAISVGVHWRALLPLKFPGVLQSERIAERQSLTVPSP